MRSILLSTAALALTMTSAIAVQSTKYHRGYVHEESYRPIHRNMADPSFGNRSGINYAKATGRCVADLGYGRFEYCGW